MTLKIINSIVKGAKCNFIDKKVLKLVLQIY